MIPNFKIVFYLSSLSGIHFRQTVRKLAIISETTNKRNLFQNYVFKHAITVFLLEYKHLACFLFTFASENQILFMAGIYLHIPFCKRRCAYCDFFSSTKADMKENYITALCRELELRNGYLSGEPVRTVYIGGGTPSQLNIRELEKLFHYIYKVYETAPQAEITLEANPDDLSVEYIRQLRTLPVNRISMGIQTFNDSLLRLLQRRHTARQAIEAVCHLREAGFENLSIDLIYGIPGCSIKDWEADLQQAMELRVPHLSAYHLTYEENTPIWKWRKEGKLQEVEEQTSLQMYEMLVEATGKAGYQHYEISNFCLPGMHSRHNSSYWKAVPYLGCGAAAHSYDGTSRQWNIASIEEYIKGIESGCPAFEREELDLFTRYNDRVITALRTIWGLPLDELLQTYGEELYNHCLKNARPHIKQGLLVIDGNMLRLTEKGIFLSDGIMSDLLWV